MLQIIIYYVFIDKYIFNKWKYFIVFNEYATGNKVIVFKNKIRHFIIQIMY